MSVSVVVCIHLKMNCFILIFAILLRVHFAVISCEPEAGVDDSRNGPTFIDQMRMDYLKLEQDLWNDIKFHVFENTTSNDDFSMLDQLRIHHLQFLSMNFYEFGIELNLFEREDEIIFDAINKINYSVVHARLKYLKDFNDLQNKLKIVSIAQDHLDLTPEMNYLFEFIASYGEYFQFVSSRSRQRFYFFSRMKQSQNSDKQRISST